MSLEIMSMQNKYFMRLLGFQVNKDENVEKIQCFILYEYGVCTLKSYIKNKNIQKWTEDQGLAFIETIQKALADLHRNKIIHLDIKLDNIVIDKTMSSFRFIDYGCE